MAKQTEQQKEKNILKRTLDKILSSKPIFYSSKRDPGEIARYIQRTRKQHANKQHQDALKEGYEYFGKQKPARIDTRTLPDPSERPGVSSYSIKKKLARNKTNTA